MLCNLAFVDQSLSLIIFKQRVCSNMLPYTYLGSTTLLFFVRLLSRMLRTLWIQNPAFVKQCVLRRPKLVFCTRPSHWSYIRICHKQEYLRPEILLSAKFFSSHHTSGPVSMSFAKIFVQETHCDDNRGDFVHHLVPWAFNTLSMVLHVCATYLLVIKNLKGFHDSLGI